MSDIEKEIRDMDFHNTLNLFDYGPVVIFRWQASEGWPVLYVSHNAGLILGYTDDEFISGEVSYAKIIHPHDQERVHREVEDNTKNRVVRFRHEPYRIVKGDGEICWVEDYTNIVRNERGEVQEYIGYVLDISEQILKERELKESRERYNLLQKATEEGLWDWNLRTDEIFFSKRWKKMLGFSSEEIGNDLDEWEKRVHPEDLESAYQDLEKYLRGESSIYENVHRMMHKDGSWLWMRDRATAVFDGMGKPIRLIGAQQDISTEIELRKQLEDRNKELLKTNRTLERISLMDPLTNLQNRRSFELSLTEEFQRALRYGRNFSLIMVDVDHFKDANDRWGHDYGDLILSTLSGLMQDAIRATDQAFRIGGEEFCVLCKETTLERAAVLAERMRARVESHLAGFEGTPVHITISCGVAEWSEGMSPKEILHNADQCMYRAKENGRNRVEVMENSEFSRKADERRNRY